MKSEVDLHTLNALQAKAVATSQGIERMPDRNKDQGGGLNPEFGEDYNTLLDSVEEAVPSLKAFFPPRARISHEENDRRFMHTRGVEIATYCMQINAMLSIAISQKERANASEAR